MIETSEYINSPLCFLFELIFFDHLGIYGTKRIPRANIMYIIN
jgi:hypothetical protein